MLLLLNPCVCGMLGLLGIVSEWWVFVLFFFFLIFSLLLPILCIIFVGEAWRPSLFSLGILCV